MNHLLDDDDLQQRQDRELTLSTGAILGIFLGLVLLCGLFFAFGYNLGQKSKSQPTTPDADAGATSSSSLSNHAKPSAGSMTAAAPVQATPLSPPAYSPAPASQTTSAPAPSSPEPIAEPVTRPLAVASQPAPMPQSSPSGMYIVQIAAVSHQEDAALLVNALRNRGYSVAARSEPGDRLIHIQVGPFDNKGEATAMRDRLLGDGYNAIIK